jgi:hypothetical protein
MGYSNWLRSFVLKCEIVARLRREMFRNFGCSNNCSYGELFEMWIVAREMFRNVGFSNYCSYGELFEMWVVARLRREMF